MFNKYFQYLQCSINVFVLFGTIPQCCDASSIWDCFVLAGEFLVGVFHCQYEGKFANKIFTFVFDYHGFQKWVSTWLVALKIDKIWVFLGSSLASMWPVWVFPGSSSQYAGGHWVDITFTAGLKTFHSILVGKHCHRSLAFTASLWILFSSSYMVRSKH